MPAESAERERKIKQDIDGVKSPDAIKHHLYPDLVKSVSIDSGLEVVKSGSSV